MARKQSRCVSSLSWSKRVNETKIGNRNRMRTSRGGAHPDSNSTMPFKVLHSTDAAEIKIRINDAAAPTDEDEEIERILQLNKIVSLKEYVCSLRRRITSLLATGTNLLTKQWKFCAVAANALPEPHRTDLLNMCHESAIRYVLSCRECVTPLPRCAPYSPLAFFTECIKKTPAKTITMSKWTNGERQESNFAASEATVRHFHERNPFPHDCELWRTIAIEVESAESAEHFSGPVEKKVNIVTGGSGSGKTSWALTSTRVGFYLTPRDFNAEDLARINGYTDCDFFKRNRDVVSTLEAALTIVIDGVLDSTMVVPMSEEPVDVSIVLDDFTEHHTFVRGLLSSGSIFFRLERLMHVKVNLNLLVIGSIADCREPGRVLMIMPLFPPDV